MSTRDVSDLAYRHIIEKLAAQQNYVIALRNQAGISSAVTGLIGTVFGTLLSEKVEVFSGNFFLGFSIWAVFAITLFSSSIAFSAMVVVHTSSFTFSFDTNTMLNKSAEFENFEKFLQSYISDGEWFFSDNEKMISDAQSKLWFAMVFGFSQIIPWIVLLRSAE